MEKITLIAIRTSSGNVVGGILKVQGLVDQNGSKSTAISVPPDFFCHRFWMP